MLWEVCADTLCPQFQWYQAAHSGELYRLNLEQFHILVFMFLSILICVCVCMPLLSSLDIPGQMAVSVRYTPVLRVKTL